MQMRVGDSSGEGKMADGQVGENSLDIIMYIRYP